MMTYPKAVHFVIASEAKQSSGRWLAAFVWVASLSLAMAAGAAARARAA